MRPLDVVLARGRMVAATTHEYWRVKFSAAQSGAYVSLDKLEFRATVSGADQCTGGTAFADSTYPGGYSASNAFDISTSTTWASNSGFPHYVGYQFPSPVAVGQIAITSNSLSYNAPDEDPKAFTVEYSDDGVSWAAAKTITSQTGWSRYETRVFSVTYRSHLQFSGADGSTNFTDDTGKTWTAGGNAQIDTSLGDQRGLFDGAGDYISTPSHVDLTFGTGDFNIKFGIRWNSKSGYQTIMSCGYTVDDLNSFIVQTGNGDGLLNIYKKASFICGESAATINTGQDYDIEIARVSGTTTIKRDGVVTATGTDPSNYAAQQFSIGGGSSTGFNNYWFNGWVKDFRVN
jgi:hypothetical protein